MRWPTGVARPQGAQPRWAVLSRRHRTQHFAYVPDWDRTLVVFGCLGATWPTQGLEAFNTTPFPTEHYPVCQLPRCQKAWRAVNPVGPKEWAEAREALKKIAKELADDPILR